VDENMAYLQEEYNALAEKYTEEKSFARNTIAILVFDIAVLIIVIINLLLRRRGRKDDFYDDEEYPDSDEPKDEKEDIADGTLHDEKEEAFTDTEEKTMYHAEREDYADGDADAWKDEVERQDKADAADLPERQGKADEADLPEKQMAADITETQNKQMKKEKKKLRSGDRQKTDDFEIIDFNDF
ncbi:MAG: hypothetical protein J6C37_11840, partial [Roseburia sp.]|nr:hypothetical protein [Roseburia sp.]